MTQPKSLIWLADAIEAAIDRYPALWVEGATLAFSGGKDSIALAAGLAATGRAPRLRAVDMGYNPEWRHRILTLGEALGQHIDIVVVADVMQDDRTEPGIRRDLALRRAFLDQDNSANPIVTPCTNCYNCKILSLVDATRRDVPTILFAHHATDALSSFVKTALMYIDRWDDGHRLFDRDRFRSLGKRMAQALRDGERSTMEKLTSLLDARLAHTAEPPFEHRMLQGHPYSIGRPLFFVQESATARLVRDLGIDAEGSGCGHTAAAATRTPREIVHHELLPMIAETEVGRTTLQDLAARLTDSLRSDGTIDIDIRAARHSLLGPDYKGGPTTLADRL